MIAVPRVLTAAGLLTLSLNTASSPQPPFGGGADVARQVGQRFERTAPKVGELMPNLQIYDADGKAIWLHDVLKGHPSVLILGCLT